MSTFMVPIVPIKAIEPIDGADNIELAVVGEFRSVVKKGLFQPGTIVAYIPENAIVPQNVLIKLGLQGRLAGKNKDRVKPIRLRGCLSQGILYPVNQGRGDGVIKLSVSQPDNVDDNIDVKLGDNVADFLGITKYEPVIPASMSGEVYNAGQHITVNFDVEHYKMYPDALTDGQEVVFTEKLHGCADYHTIVDTIQYGPIEIGTIVERKLEAHVASYNINTNELEYNLIVGHQQLPNNDDWYELETEDGKCLRLTGNHPVWLPEISSYRRVDQLTGTEKVLLM